MVPLRDLGNVKVIFGCSLTCFLCSLHVLPVPWRWPFNQAPSSNLRIDKLINTIYQNSLSIYEWLLNSCFCLPDPFLEDYGQQGSYHCGAALGTRWTLTPGRTLQTKLNLFNNSSRRAQIAWCSFKIDITGSNTLLIRGAFTNDVTLIWRFSDPSVTLLYPV